MTINRHAGIALVVGMMLMSAIAASIMVQSQPSGQGRKHGQRHDVAHWHRVDKDLIISDAFSFNQCGWHVV